jgi:hypothetical protein
MAHFEKRRTPDKTKRHAKNQAHPLYVTSQNTKLQLFQTEILSITHHLKRDKVTLAVTKIHDGRSGNSNPSKPSRRSPGPHDFLIKGTGRYFSENSVAGA